MRFTFGKHERLASEVDIKHLFQKGEKHFSHPFLCLYKLEVDEQEPWVKIAISVPKKHYKRAAVRNLVRRRVKEVFRLNKVGLNELLRQKSQKLSMVVIVVKTDNISYDQLERGFMLTLHQLRQLIEQHV